MTAPELSFVVPGPLDQRTGGYLYDARMVAGLGQLGWRVEVLSLPGSFPGPDRIAREALVGALRSLPAGKRLVVDGLAMGGLPGPVREHGGRLRILSLVHHPLALETGLSEQERTRLQGSERDALGACVGVVVTSEYTARVLTDYGVSPQNVRTVRPGTDRAGAARGPGPGSPPRLVCVGSVIPRKGQDVLVAALNRIRDLPWTCVCAGSLERDPEYAAAVLAETSRSGLDGRVTFTGERDEADLDALYDGASIFVLPSHYEGYGMALAEALARGLPVVSTTGGAIPYTVPREAGLLVEPGDVTALAEALRSLLSGSTERRDALNRGARLHAERLPTWEQSAQAFAAAVEELAP